MSVASHESNRSVFELVAERYQWVRESMRRPWRIIPPKAQPGTQTDIAPEENHSFASFRSEPALKDEDKVHSWDDGVPGLKHVDSFALSKEMVQQAEGEGKGPFRFLNNILLQAIAVVCIVCLIIK